MSAYICSDKHFAVVAKALFAQPHNQQSFANHLKRENIRSVNHRYREKTRVTRVNLDAATPIDVNAYMGHDILRLLQCIDYQSCEHPDYDDTMYKLAVRVLEAQGADAAKARENLWSI
jgi:hypothetical protein